MADELNEDLHAISITAQRQVPWGSFSSFMQRRKRRQNLARLPALGGLMAVACACMASVQRLRCSRCQGGSSGVQKEKRRTPAWTDRVLYRGGARPVKQLTYTSANLLVSDHKPVCSNLRLQVGQSHCSLTDPATDCSVCRAPAGLHLALKWTLCK